MYYRIVYVDLKTGEKQLGENTFSNKKNAIKHASQFISHTRNMTFAIYKDDMKERVY